MDLKLSGKVAWVTGGSGGIGSAVAAQLAAEGADVAISGRDIEKLEQVAQRIAGDSGRRVLPAPAEATSTAQLRAAASRIVAELGGIDILVNCAGALGGRANGPLEQLDVDAMLSDLDEKYVGYVRAAQAAVPSMKQRAWGRLIHIAGMSGRSGGSYSAGGRNIAIVHVSKTLSDELGPHGITSNVVHPAITRTPAMEARLAAQADARGITLVELEDEIASVAAIRHVVTAEEVANVVTFLASPLSLAITGETIAVSGGTQRTVSV